jgi:hypothetical protein
LRRRRSILTAQHPEEIWQKLDFVDDYQTPNLFIEIKVGLCEDLAIRGPFHIKVYSVARVSYVLRQRCLTDLPRPQQDDASLAIQRFFDQLSMLPI